MIKLMYNKNFYQFGIITNISANFTDTITDVDTGNA